MHCIDYFVYGNTEDNFDYLDNFDHLDREDNFFKLLIIGDHNGLPRRIAAA